MGLYAALWINEGWMKEFFARNRPFVDLENVRLLVAEPGNYSFPSGHAAISFTIATIVAIRHRNLAFVVFLWAALVTFTRVYIGVHYPMDLAAGICEGMLLGCVIVWSMRWAVQKANRIFKLDLRT